MSVPAPLPLALAASLLAILLLVPELSGCSEAKSPEEQIRARLDEGAAALEDNDLPKAAALLHDDYRDAAGRDERAMKALAFFLLRQGPVHLNLSDVRTEVAPGGEQATVRAKVLAVQGNATIEQIADALPRGARQVDVTVRLVKAGGDWYVAAIDGDGLGRRDP